MIRLPAGTLNRRLTYQTRVNGDKNSLGQPVPGEYTTVGTYWGGIRSPNGREATNALQMKAEASHIVTIRYQGFDLDPKGRFLYKSRIFNIGAILNVDELNRQVDLMCTEVVSPVTPS